MKRTWNFLWVFLTVSVTVAGFFLPRLALRRQGTPNFSMNYQTVEISSRASANYALRLKTLVRQQMDLRSGDAYPDEIQQTDITDRYSAEEQGNMIAQLLLEAQTLTDAGVLPAAISEMMENGSCEVTVLYLFDTETLRGFPYGRFFFVQTAGGKQNDSYQIVHAWVDLSGGKLLALQGYGCLGNEVPGNYPTDAAAWQERLRSYADYLELGETTTDNRKDGADTEIIHESFATDARLGALSPDGDGWFELRAVYDSGMDVFSVLLYRTNGK